MLLLFRFIITFIIVMLIAHNVTGFEINDYTDAVFFAIILSAVNALVRPVLTLLTLPISILTLGLFSLVINTFTFWLAAEISYGIHITTWEAACWGGFFMWLTGIITNRFIWHTNLH